MADAMPTLVAIYLVLALVWVVAIAVFAYVASMHINRSRVRYEDLSIRSADEVCGVTMSSLNAAQRDFHDAYGVLFMVCLALEGAGVTFPAVGWAACADALGPRLGVLLAMPFALHLVLVTRLHREMPDYYRVECRAMGLPRCYRWNGRPCVKRRRGAVRERSAQPPGAL